MPPPPATRRQAGLLQVGPATAIAARGPLRLGLAGGGSDLSPYCDTHGGAVLNTTIDRYAYARIAASADGRWHFEAADLGIAESLSTESFSAGNDRAATARLALHAGVARRMLLGATEPTRITTWVDAPPGSGLGSSSALAVALVEACRGWLGLPLSPADVAQLAFIVERRDLRRPGGRQDQYAAALGGVNFLEFHAGDQVTATPLALTPGTRQGLEDMLLLCETGFARDSDAIIARQAWGAGRPGVALEALHQLKRDAFAMRDALLTDRLDLIGPILSRSWEAKLRTARGVGTPRVAALLGLARAHGAQAGKVSGAGGGGFLMLVVPPERRESVAAALAEAGARTSPPRLTRAGARCWAGDEPAQAALSDAFARVE